MSEAVTNTLSGILVEVLGKDPASFSLQADTALLGAIPEFDSMAVVSVLTAVEEEFDVMIDDDEVDAEVFENFGTLNDFVTRKVSG